MADASDARCSSPRCPPPRSTDGDRSRAARGSWAPSPRERIADSLGLPLEPDQRRAPGAANARDLPCAGHFTPGAAEEEWCERGLLARIHRYTVKRLRAEIEPVPARDFLRFLFEWQRVLPDARMQGSDAVAAVLAQLEGFEAPAARVGDRHPALADHRVRAGLAGRALPLRAIRVDPACRRAPLDRDRGASPIRSTPITLLARRNVKAWSAFTEGQDPAAAHLEGSRRDGIHRRRMAPRSSMRSQKTSACCRSKSRKRSRNWWRSAS